MGNNGSMPSATTTNNPSQQHRQKFSLEELHCDKKIPEGQQREPVSDQNQLACLNNDYFNQNLKTNHCSLSSQSTTPAKATKPANLKVLPDFNPDIVLRLRSTINGDILNSGGTISGRNLDEQSKKPSSLILSSSPSSMKQLLSYNNLNPIINQQTDRKNNLLKNKKKKTAPSSPKYQYQKDPEQQHKKRNRLFKTNAETKRVQPNYLSPVQLSSTDDVSLKLSTPSRKDYVFRREKSFDLSLLRNHNTLIGNNVNKIEQNKNQITDNNIFPVISTASCISFDENIDNFNNCSKKLEHVQNNPIENDNNFKKELKEATLKRQNSKWSGLEKNKQNNVTIIDNFAAIINQDQNIKSKKFYFGMSSRANIPTQQQNQQFPISNYVKYKSSVSQTSSSSSSSCSINESESYCVPVIGNYNNINFNDCNISDNIKIQNIRPTLPRRQFEIPRFSPTVAWRMLNDEQQQQHQQLQQQVLLPRLSPNEKLELPQIMTEHNSGEKKIQQIIREAPYFHYDNKSGDSGISGDNANIDIENHNTNQIHNNQSRTVEKFSINNKIDKLISWTPQQDLNDDDASSTSDPNDGCGKFLEATIAFNVPCSDKKLNCSISGTIISTGTNNTQIIGLNNLCGTATVNDPTSVYNYRNDNWLLSRSAPTSFDLHQHHNNYGTYTIHNNNTEVVTDENIAKNSTTNVLPVVSLNYVASGKHKMYLPTNLFHHDEKNNLDNTNEQRKKNNLDHNSHETVPKEFTTTSLQLVKQVVPNSNPKTSHRFKFQSTIRQIERKRLAERLSKEADEQEALRKSELEVMTKVEEEFQRKRAREKAEICQKLRLLEEENPYSSLPNIDLKTTSNIKNKKDNNCNNDKLFIKYKGLTEVTPSSGYNSPKASLARNRCRSQNKEFLNYSLMLHKSSQY